MTQEQIMEQFYKDCKQLDEDGLPERIKFDMEHFKRTSDCSTVACGAGTLFHVFGRDYYNFGTSYSIKNDITHRFLFSMYWFRYDKTFEGFLARARYLFKEGSKKLTGYFEDDLYLYRTKKERIKKKYLTWD